MGRRLDLGGTGSRVSRLAARRERKRPAASEGVRYWAETLRWASLLSLLP